METSKTQTTILQNTPALALGINIGSIVKVVSASLFIAICAQIAVPFYPVPMTMQTFAIMFIGMILPWRMALSAASMYVIEAFIGLPVLAGFNGGPAAVFGMNAGYIFGFILMATFIAFYLEKTGSKGVFNKVAASVIGLLILYAFGLSVLAFYIGIKTAISVGLMPFILSIPVKIGLAVTASALWVRHGSSFKSK